MTNDEFDAQAKKVLQENPNISAKDLEEMQKAEKTVTDLKFSLLQNEGLDNHGRLPIDRSGGVLRFVEPEHGADIPERPPVHNRFPAVWDLVVEDMNKRDVMGTKKYGGRLRPFNKRDPLWDAYQEALDMVAYLRQAIFERDGK